MKKLITGVIGAGRIGKLHTDNLIRMPNVDVKMIADPYLDQDWVASRNLNGSLDVNDIFNDNEIDAVLIFSPSALHADHIKLAASSGQHIFCEKPIALDPEKILDALAAVKKAGVILQIGFNRRFDPNFAKLRQAVATEQIGKLHFIKIVARDPEPPPAEYIKVSGGMFLDMTIHDFDMVRFLADSEVDEVYVAGRVLIDKIFAEYNDVDTAITTLKLKNGALAVIDNSRQAVYGYDQRVEVFGSKGGMIAENNTPTQTILNCADGVISDKPLYFFLERYQKSFQLEIADFINTVLENREASVGGIDGLNSILIGLAANKSLKENRPVKIEEVMP